MANEARREEWREYAREKTETLRSNPGAWEAAQAAKAEYDRAYRERKRDDRRIYMHDPENVARWNAMRREKYHRRENHSHQPRVKLPPEEALRRTRESYRRYGQRNKDRRRAYAKRYRQEHKAELREQTKQNRRIQSHTDPFYRMLRAARRRVSELLMGKTKSAHTMELIGCNRAELRAHIERQFKPGMTWENYGRNGWHLDHVRPVSSFDLSIAEEQRACWRFENLQPLWAIDNMIKGNKYPLAVPHDSPKPVPC